MSSAFLLAALLAAPAASSNWPPAPRGGTLLAAPAGAADKEAQRELDAVLAKVAAGELPRIQFELGSARIELRSYATLDAIATILLRYPKVKLMVRAHTCTLGSQSYNIELSQRRAKAVKGFLVQRGVPPPSIRFRGLGYSEPLADNATEEGRAQNRRVEFRLSYRDWASVY